MRVCKQQFYSQPDETYKIQNNLCENLKFGEVLANDLPQFFKMMEELGFNVVFDTIKEDFHYAKPNMESRVQLQQIKDIGLVLYYDNSNYYHLPFDEQRKALIDELNSYGFEFSEKTPDLNKLESLRDNKLSFHINQEGNSYLNEN